MLPHLRALDSRGQQFLCRPREINPLNFDIGISPVRYLREARHEHGRDRSSQRGLIRLAR
jgi:hypothetical protein